MILDAAKRGLRRAGALWGLVLFLLAVNLATAAVLAVPLARRWATTSRTIRRRRQHALRLRLSVVVGLGRRASADDVRARHPRHRLRVQEPRPAPARRLPAGLFALPDPDRTDESGSGVDPTVLALGAAYLVLQVFLSGGVIAALRAPQPEWTVRGLLHGSGFYFGRFLRLTPLMLLVDAPSSRSTDRSRAGRTPRRGKRCRSAPPSSGCWAGTPCCFWSFSP